MPGGAEEQAELQTTPAQNHILELVPLQVLLQQLRGQVQQDAGPSMPKHSGVLGLAGAGIEEGW